MTPSPTRSRAARALTAAAGRFALQVCGGCGAAAWPPRDACPRCLSPDLPLRDVPAGGTVVADTTIRASGDAFFRARLPWRVGTVRLDCGPICLAHLHGAAGAGARVRMVLRLDASGQAVLFALPRDASPDDDPQWRALDP